MKMSRPLVIVLGAALVAAACVTGAWLRKPRHNFVCANGACASKDLDRSSFRDTRWYELGPKGWDPYKLAADMRRNVGSFSDADPRAAELLNKMRTIWVNAPINPDLVGKAVRMPGFVVPLDPGREGTDEFLLVPYFGACIHSPPPPSNQILHVVLPGPAQGIKSMEQVWVRGLLRASRSETTMGASGYQLDAVSIEPYVR